MPPNLVSNLQQALNKRKDAEEDQSSEATSSSSKQDNVFEEDPSKPRILVINADGIESPGLKFLVEALVLEGLYNVYVCAPELWVIAPSLSCYLWFWAFAFAIKWWV